MSINNAFMSGDIARLYQLIAEHGLNEAGFARALNTSPQRINNWRRRGALPAAELLRIAQHFGVRPEWLSSGAEPKYPPLGAPALRGLLPAPLRADIERLARERQLTAEEMTRWLLERAVYGEVGAREPKSAPPPPERALIEVWPQERQDGEERLYHGQERRHQVIPIDFEDRRSPEPRTTYRVIDETRLTIDFAAEPQTPKKPPQEKDPPS